MLDHTRQSAAYDLGEGRTPIVGKLQDTKGDERVKAGRRAVLNCYPEATAEEKAEAEKEPMYFPTEGWTNPVDAGGGSAGVNAAAAVIDDAYGPRGSDDRSFVIDVGTASNPRDGVEVIVRGRGGRSLPPDWVVEKLKTRFDNVTVREWAEAPDALSIAVGKPPVR